MCWLRPFPMQNGNNGRGTSPGIPNLMPDRLDIGWRNCTDWTTSLFFRRPALSKDFILPPDSSRAAAWRSLSLDSVITVDLLPPLAASLNTSFCLGNYGMPRLADGRICSNHLM